MKLKTVVAVLSISIAVIASVQAFAQTAVQTLPTETKYVMVNGEVVRYEVGHVIVVRGADKKEVTYNLSPTLVMPKDIKVGREVTLYTEPGVDGATQLVSRVTTTSVTPEGQVKRTTEDTRALPSGATSRTTTTNTSGKIESYEAGKTLTITRADGKKMTYLINDKSTVPAGMVIGKDVTILPVSTTGAGEMVAQTITYVTVQ